LHVFLINLDLAGVFGANTGCNSVLNGFEVEIKDSTFGKLIQIKVLNSVNSRQSIKLIFLVAFI
jgi:hypothetical protein